MSEAGSNRPRLYGRSKGRPLRPQQQKLMDELYPRVQVESMPAPSPSKPVWMEIGFGGAEHVVNLAEKNRDVTVIGAEPFLNGVAKALMGIEAFDLDNLFLHHGDARDIMDGLPDGILDRLYILFPDPWPKTRHNKRRIINAEFLTDVRRVLKPGGTLFFASDIIDYVDWTITRLKRDGGFSLEVEGPGAWRVPYEGWPGTRYEAKAIKAGRPCHYLKFLHAA